MCASTDVRCPRSREMCSGCSALCLAATSGCDKGCQACLQDNKTVANKDSRDGFDLYAARHSLMPEGAKAHFVHSIALSGYAQLSPPCQGTLKITSMGVRGQGPH